MPLCPECGWTIAEGVRYCPSCGTKTIADDAAAEPPLPVKQAPACPACGVRMEYEPPGLLFVCPACRAVQNAVRLPADVGELAVTYLPFEIVEPRAESLMARFLRIEGPFSAHNRHRVKNLSFQRVYLPFWQFSMKAESHYSTKFDTPMLSLLDRNVEPANEPLIREYRHAAYPAFLDKMVERTQYLQVLPYDFTRAEPLVAGALDDARVEPLVLPIADAQAKVVNPVQRKQLEICSADAYVANLAVADIKTTCRDWQAAQVFAPAWEIRYTIDDKPARMLINGQTGAINGVTPAFVWTDLKTYAAYLIIAQILLLVFAKFACS